MYVIPANLPSDVKHSSDALHILTVLPPDAGVHAYMDLVQDDLVTGATEGFLCSDAVGITFRVFLDFLGWVADTPAGTDLLNVRGSSAFACCHLCRFQRHSKSHPTPTSTNITPIAQYTPSRRYAARHRSIRYSNPNECYLKWLGMRSNPSAKNGTLTRLSTALREARPFIARNSLGQRIVPGLFDPYQGTFPGPDHIMKNHFEALINSFLVTSTPSERSSFENSLRTSAKRAGVPLPKSLFTKERTRIADLKMSTLFSLPLLIRFGSATTHNIPSPSSSTSPSRSKLYHELTQASVLFNVSWADPAAIVTNEHLDVRQLQQPSLLMAKVDAHLTSLEEILTFPRALEVQLRHARPKSQLALQLKSKRSQCEKLL